MHRHPPRPDRRRDDPRAGEGHPVDDMPEQAGARREHGREEGSALLWLLGLVPALFAAAGLIFDGGAAINAKQEGANIADQAARVGVDQMAPNLGRVTQIPSELDIARANAAACSYVATALPGATCSANLAGTQMHVQVSRQVPTQFLGLIGINTHTVTADGTAVTATGIDQEVPQ